MRAAMRDGGDWRALVARGRRARHRRARPRVVSVRRAIRSSSCSRRARGPRTRRPEGADRERGGARRRTSTGSPRRARTACSMRSGRAGRRRARSRTGRCSATGPTSFPGARSSRRSAAGRTVDDEHVFAYAALRPAERAGRRPVAHRTPGPGPRRRLRRSALVERVRRDRGRRADVHARARLARRGGPPHRRRRRRAGHRHRRVLQGPPSRCCGRCRSCRRPSGPPARPRSGRAGRGADRRARVNARRAEADAGVQRDHAEVVGTADSRVPTFLERHGLRGHVHRRVGVPARAGARDRPRGDRGSPRRTTRPATCAGGSSSSSERLDAGDTFVFVHQKATDAAGHTKDPLVKRAMIE